MESILPFNEHAMGHQDGTQHVSESSQYVSELDVSETTCYRDTPVDSDLHNGYCYPPFEQLWLGFSAFFNRHFHFKMISLRTRAEILPGIVS